MLSSLFDNFLQGNRLRRVVAKAAAAIETGDIVRAVKILEPAYRAAPRNARVAMLLGQALIDCDQLTRGFELLDKAVRLAPELTEARVAIAGPLQYAGQIGTALEHLRAALVVAPDAPQVHKALMRPLMEVCDWNSVSREREDLCARIDSGGSWTDFITPMDALLLGLPSGARRAAAEARAVEIQRSERRAGGIRERHNARGARLRVGYLSGDFRDHAVTHLAGNLFPCHDRGRFEVLAFSYGRDDGSIYRRRVMEGVDGFIDVRGNSNFDIARRINAAGVDILIDLAGHTSGSRLGVLAHRPCPVQAHYLGYPGTTGARFVDYFLADATVAPPALNPEFTERFVRLPDSFMISDETVGTAPPTERAAHGLPAGAFVFVNFNQSSRIDQHVWRIWMEILHAVPHGVLWLKHANDIACANLRATANAEGIDPARLVFARDVPEKTAHISRLRLANLGLDTFGRYNGHTSTADALWAGVPVVTAVSDCFPGRVAASLLAASGMAECVASDIASYKAIAIGCAQDQDRLRVQRAALADARRRAPFFQPERTVRALERAYAAMWDRHNSRLAPAAIDVAPGRGE